MRRLRHNLVSTARWVRWISLGAGTALVALAFAAATRVSDTREGLIAEAITLLGGLAGVALLIYGFTAGRVSHAPTPTASRSDLPRELGGKNRKPRSARDSIF